LGIRLLHGNRNFALFDRRRRDPEIRHHGDVSGIDIPTVGVILMIVGIIGLVISLFFLGEWRSRHRAVIDERPVVPRDREYY